MLRSWGLDAEVPTVELLVSELLTNAVQHGEAPIQMRLSWDGERIRLEVADVGRASAPRLSAAGKNGGVGGWGLRFVDQLAESWGVQHERDGTLVWTVTRAGRAEGRQHQDPA